MRRIRHISVTKLNKALVNNYLLQNDLTLSVYSITSVDHFVDIKISYLQPFSYTIYNGHKQTSFSAWGAEQMPNCILSWQL